MSEYDSSWRKNLGVDKLVKWALDVVNNPSTDGLDENGEVIPWCTEEDFLRNLADLIIRHDVGAFLDYPGGIDGFVKNYPEYFPEGFSYYG